MKQTMKMMARLIKRAQNQGRDTVRLKGIVALVEQGRLVPLAQSHREVKTCGPLFQERHTGVIWSCSPSGLLDSSLGLPDLYEGRQVGRALTGSPGGNWRPLGYKSATRSVSPGKIAHRYEF